MGPALASGRHRYAIGAVIARGGMAEVREGTDTRTGRAVAIKRIRPDLAGRAEIRERFAGEIAMAGRVAHPGLVSILDVDEFAGVPFLVLERLEGTTLRDRLERGPLTLVETHDLCTQLMGALRAVHDAGVVHADLKPTNVFLGKSGVWKLGDFGIARRAGERHPDELLGTVLGTPEYVAPERLRGDAATLASDYYALGVILHEALTGAKPAPGAPRRTEGDPLAAVSRAGGESLVRLIVACLLTDPVTRMDAVTRSFDELAVPTTGEATQALVAAEHTRSMEAGVVRRPRPRGIRRSTIVAVSLVAAGLVTAASAALDLGGRPTAGARSTSSLGVVHGSSTPSTLPSTLAPSLTSQHQKGDGHSRGRGRGHGDQGGQGSQGD